MSDNKSNKKSTHTYTSNQHTHDPTDHHPEDDKEGKLQGQGDYVGAAIGLGGSSRREHEHSSSEEELEEQEQQTKKLNPNNIKINIHMIPTSQAL